MNLTWQSEEFRIFAEDDTGKLLAEITFPSVNGFADINHTFVDPSLRGQGIADTLIRKALAVIKKKGLKLRTSCPYAAKWLIKHPEVSDLSDI